MNNDDDDNNNYNDNDTNDLKKIMQNFKQEIPLAKVNRWQLLVRKERQKRINIDIKAKWWQLAFACFVGFMLAQAPHFIPNSVENFNDSATIELISIN